MTDLKDELHNCYKYTPRQNKYKCLMKFRKKKMMKMKKLSYNQWYFKIK